MHDTAKVFIAGNSQAVRLPRAYRVDVAEMWISRNEHTGEITLRPKPSPQTLALFMAALTAQPENDEFLQPRDDLPRPDPLANWAE